jgi:hypothetical protein
LGVGGTLGSEIKITKDPAEDQEEYEDDNRKFA